MVYEIVIDALTPHVGKMAADTCVRATALRQGKTADELGSGDAEELYASVRRLLAHVAPIVVIEAVIEDISRRLE